MHLTAAAWSKVMVHPALQQTLKRSLSTFAITRSSWTHHTASPRATSRHDPHLACHQTTGRLAAAVIAVECLGGAREFSSSATAATARARVTTTEPTAASKEDTSIESKPASSTWTAKDPILLDAPFLDMVRQRLKEKDDTSAYFMHCKDDPVRQAGVFMVSEKLVELIFYAERRNPSAFSISPL